MRRQLIIALLWTAAGCGVSFPENHLIEDLRVLNIRAEPPEVGLFVKGGLELEPLPSFATSTVVRFTVLAAHPDLDAKLRFDWFRCAPEDPSDAPLRGLPCDASARVRLDLAGTSTLTVSPVGEVLDDLESRGDTAGVTALFGGDPRALINGFYGYFQVAASIQDADVAVDTQRLEATKRLVIFEPRVAHAAVQLSRDPTLLSGQQGRLPIDIPTLCLGAPQSKVDAITAFLRSRPTNRNPTLDRVTVTRLSRASTSTRSLPGLEIAPSQQIELVASGSEAEPYELIDGNCELLSFKERLAYSWFTSRGGLERQVTSDDRPTTVYTAPNAADLPSGRTRIRIYVVVRDGRGGSDHRTFDLSVVK